jgi:hypothetical protein
VEEYATVVHGGGVGFSIAAMLEAHLCGVLGALADVDPRGTFRRIIFCELDEARFVAMRNALITLASSRLFDDVEVTLDEPTPPLSRSLDLVSERGPARSDIYINVHELARTDSELTWRVSVLSAGRGATVFTRDVEIAEPALAAKLAELRDGVHTALELEQWGVQLAELCLPPDVLDVLRRAPMRDACWTIIHDAPTSRVPWEALGIATRSRTYSPAQNGGLSRRYDGPAISSARWLQGRRIDEHLDILLVINPKGDLEGARAEADVITNLMEGNPRIHVTPIPGRAASIERVLTELGSGKYDVLHYAGHAAFDEHGRRSWLELADGRLEGARLAGLRSLPMLAVLNACESARIRKDTAQSRDHGADVLGLAETLLVGGIGHFVGTHWPVGDDAAKGFAAEFYSRILAGDTIAEATRRGRIVVKDLGSRDWANFVHWGATDGRVKQGAE